MRIGRRVPGDIFAWTKMRQRQAERSRLARPLLIRDEQLLPRPAQAVVGRLVNVNMAVLIKTEQCRLRIISHCLEDLVDRGKAIGKPITVRKTCMAQQLGDVERMQRWRSAAGRRIARQLEK